MGDDSHHEKMKGRQIEEKTWKVAKWEGDRAKVERKAEWEGLRD